MKLSRNFTLAEATKSDTALRLGLDNTPGSAQINAMGHVAQCILQPVRDHYGIPFSPSSWFRCLDLNRAIGSKDNSQHIAGEAVDFEVPGVSNLSLGAWCRDNLYFDQLIHEFFNPDDPAAGWIHCSAKCDGDNRAQVISIG